MKSVGNHLTAKPRFKVAFPSSPLAIGDDQSARVMHLSSAHFAINGVTRRRKESIPVHATSSILQTRFPYLPLAEIVGCGV
jgi:hypothetical protein